MAACPLHPQPLAFRTTVNTPPKQKTENSSRWLLLLAAAAIIALITLNFVSGSKPQTTLPETQASATESTPEKPPAENPLDNLKGRWLRADGGYILEVKHTSPDGRVEAAYFNPRPIFVSRAEASEKDSGIQLLVELQDQGYPGCVYTLNYQPDSDSLIGTYFQAALRESFDVVFERTR
ncbi:MAG: hypothetical protein RI897_2858 [Verrucomicrobiota bacterium]